MKPVDSSSWDDEMNLLDQGGPIGHDDDDDDDESHEFNVAASSVHGNVNLSAIDRIADGVERMIDAWDLEKVQRGQEYANVFKSLATATHSTEIQQPVVKMKVLPAAATQLTHQDKMDEDHHCNVHRSSPWSTHQEDPLDKGRHGRSVINPNHHHPHHMQRAHAIQCKVPEEVRNHQARDHYHEKINGRPVMKHEFNNKFVHPLDAVYRKNCNSNWLANNQGHHQHISTGPVIETKEFTDPGCPGVTFLQDRFTGATVLEIRRNYGGGCVRIQTSGNHQSEGRLSRGYQSDTRMSSGESMDDTGSHIQLLVNEQIGQIPPKPPPPASARIIPTLINNSMQVPEMGSRGEHELVQMPVAGHGETTSMKEAEAEVGDNLNLVAKFPKYCFSRTSSGCYSSLGHQWPIKTKMGA